MEKVFVFDLDNTLYPQEVGLWRMVDRRIEEYVARTLKVDRDTARNVRKGFLRIYGTTLKGLMLNHFVKADDYLSYVHDVEVEKILEKDRELVEIINSIPHRKFVFTNASGEYALRVLSSLGIEQCFEEVLDIDFMDFLAKPGLYPFRKLISYLGVSPGRIVFFDDMVDNIATAKTLGIYSLLVSPNGKDVNADMVIDNVKHIPSILDKIMEGSH